MGSSHCCKMKRRSKIDMSNRELQTIVYFWYNRQTPWIRYSKLIPQFHLTKIIFKTSLNLNHANLLDAELIGNSMAYEF